jgi:hypothetical protein
MKSQPNRRFWLAQIFIGFGGRSRGFDHDEFDHSPLEMFFPDNIILPESYQAYLASLASAQAQETLQGL